jgi:hypothetical protein
MTVHNHDLDPTCRETRTADGLKGACMTPDAPIHDQAAIRNSFDEDEVTRIVHRVGAALNSGTDRAVVQVVLDETETLRDEVDKWRTAALEFEAAYVTTHDTLTKRSAAHDRLVATVGRVRALLFRHYTGSPAYEQTPAHITELDAIADLYDDRLAGDLRAALDATEDAQ